MKNVLTALWALVVAGSLVCLTLRVPEPAQSAANSPEKVVWDKTIEIPPNVRPMNIECGAPCLIYWDPMSERYVAAFADGGVIYFVFPKPEEPAEGE